MKPISPSRQYAEQVMRFGKTRDNPAVPDLYLNTEALIGVILRLATKYITAAFRITGLQEMISEGIMLPTADEALNELKLAEK